MNYQLSVLIILLSLQTKLGEKISILADRVVDFWNGNQSDKKKKKKKNTQQQQTNEEVITQSLDSTPISSIPVQQQPNFNQMYQIDNTPLIGAATPGGEQIMEPMAANSMGGSAFGSLF